MTNRYIDPIHPELNEFGLDLIDRVWDTKYKWGEEADIMQTVDRVVLGVYADDDANAADQMSRLMREGLFVPGGRIWAGAGTAKRVTLMNCYVNERLEDSMEGIHRALGNTMFTLQQGGGIGTDFTPLRPAGATLTRTGPGSAASGPIPFMKQWDATSMTIRSAGDRRGAMMGTLADHHPDLPAFIDAKQTPGVLTQFNVSVLVSDAFMEAVKEDKEWVLWHYEPPVERDEDLAAFDVTVPNEFYDEVRYAYAVWRARDLWEKIMRGTYVYAEPGVIFIDRVNALNNLNHVEHISCTNPCGEQPLPPDGACNLGAVNLSRIVRNPFTNEAKIDTALLEMVVAAAVRFLDNVIDITAYPLEAQEQEQINKRRIGLGITGLADCLAQMGLVYGSDEAVATTKAVMRKIANAAYFASSMLAKDRGSFPLFDDAHIELAEFFQKLDTEVQESIRENGLRNGVLLTIAPTGTTSLIMGNVSSGLEPTFAHSYNRKIFSSNNEHEAESFEDVQSYTWRLWVAAKEGRIKGPLRVDADWLPDYLITAQELDVISHLKMQAACQEWVDASITKTVNVPTETSFEDFMHIYELAYEMGCKGCTTYRPDPTSGRGSVIEVAAPSTGEGSGEGEDPADLDEGPELDTILIRERPELLAGCTYKIKWPSWSSSIYMTINHDEMGMPFEIFLLSKDTRHQEWMTALTVLISTIMRREPNIQFIVDELKSIQSVGDGAWVGGKFHGSLLARIGEVMEQHFARIGLFEEELPPESSELAEHVVVETRADEAAPGEVCPACGTPGMRREEGCFKCPNCGHSKCG